MNFEEEVVVLSEPKRKTIKWDDEQLLTLLEQVYALKPYPSAKKSTAYDSVAYVLSKSCTFKGYALSGQNPCTCNEYSRRIYYSIEFTSPQVPIARQRPIKPSKLSLDSMSTRRRILPALQVMKTTKLITQRSCSRPRISTWIFHL